MRTAKGGRGGHLVLAEPPGFERLSRVPGHSGTTALAERFAAHIDAGRFAPLVHTAAVTREPNMR
jgi:hypothetical protein